MAQWHACKKMAKDAVLLFRMGDFYEAFYDDAAAVSRELDLTLTQRQGIPMAGVPCHASEGYIDKLVAKGYRVALAEQLDDPKKTKGLVRREVVRVITPGTVVSSSLLSDKSNNFITSLAQVDKTFGLAYLDLSTGEFRVIEFDGDRDLLNELFRLHPSECVVSEKFCNRHALLLDEMRNSFPLLVSHHDDWQFDYQTAYHTLTGHFRVHSLDGFGLGGMTAGVNAAGALLNYLKDRLCLSLEHLHQISTYNRSHLLSLDRITQRNLELTESLKDGSRRHTLVDILDRTRTSMGGRLMRQMVKQPLVDTVAISKRQDAVEAFLSQRVAAADTTKQLDAVRDLERLMTKLSSGFASPRDLVALRLSLEQIPLLKRALGPLRAAMIHEEIEQLHPLTEVSQLIASALVDEPPARLHDSPSFRPGFHSQLDELREIGRDSQAWLARYQNQLREQTGIKTLKVGYTRMFGYYIEVSRGQSDKMPDSFQRRQTLVNAERFLSPELKEFEHKALTAEDRAQAIETELFAELRTQVVQYAEPIMRTAQAIARIDCLCGLADVAYSFGYTRPKVDNSNTLKIVDGRHPVIEGASIGERFIPNDTLLDDGQNRLFVITGPNMAGKSTYIRQVALLVIMAQIGSFIPAREAHIGVVDKVFTRIGASDDLSRGQSTFMVEMTETANILNNATDRSLVILDEIGRGTSTYDGISIAWAVAEHLLTTPGRRAKTLFATHYWELTQLEEKIPGAVNYHVAVKEHDDQVIFLRKIVKGSTDKSYGIQVGRLAGLPTAVIARAKEILVHLENTHGGKNSIASTGIKSRPMIAQQVKNSDREVQLLLFEPEQRSVTSV